MTMNLRILSHSADVSYNGLTIPLLSFIHRLSCVDIPNTEEPAIFLDMSDDTFNSTEFKPRLDFFKLIVEQLKYSSSLQTPEYNATISKMTAIISTYKRLYKEYEVRKNTPEGKIVSYHVSDFDVYPPPIVLVYENGVSRMVEVDEFLILGLDITPDIQTVVDMRNSIDEFNNRIR
jgi:hypothetical protein